MRIISGPKLIPFIYKTLSNRKDTLRINQYFKNPNLAPFGFNKITETKGINKCRAVNNPTVPSNTAVTNSNLLFKSRSAISTGTFRNRTVTITSLFITKDLILTQHFTCTTVSLLNCKLPGAVTIGP
ncbi:hypothetical protein GGTG_11547 [Gaeumannomyces tritici R3-111a-1]|uniref:Uncharacterized protein n=1 Tax=Gaeumannomyces tritici (strain R3-111a-1) TaxID=644352 RepID=J3PDH4_GAET3|nr:hypothetical protein GGTG_11547 [Gaeumannomyces tritici R3-111a-1]EJT70524.1 hypothetical protein GGTG_11547 [Gaeumannomyces tritici R3-111a-1]